MVKVAVSFMVNVGSINDISSEGQVFEAFWFS